MNIFATGIETLASAPLTPHPSDEAYVEWTIKNKYYTAPVHLYLHQISKPPAKPLWPPETDDERVPALIFVFRKGEVSEIYVGYHPGIDPIFGDEL